MFHTESGATANEMRPTQMHKRKMTVARKKRILIEFPRSPPRALSMTLAGLEMSEENLLSARVSCV